MAGFVRVQCQENAANSECLKRLRKTGVGGGAGDSQHGDAFAVETRPEGGHQVGLDWAFDDDGQVGGG